MTTQNGEWRLITNRANALYTKYNIRTTIYAINDKKRISAIKNLELLKGNLYEIIYISYLGVIGLIETLIVVCPNSN